MQIITSWDDWCDENFAIAGLLQTYNLPGIFYLPIKGTDWDRALKLQEMGFSIQSHSWTHPPDMKLLTTEQKVVEICASKYELEKITGKTVTSFCYPRGRYDQECVDLLQWIGYTEARTTKVLSSMVEDRYRTGTSIHVYQRIEYNGKPVVDVARDFYDKHKDDRDAVFHIWGHGWELNRDNLFNDLETILSYITKRGID